MFEVSWEWVRDEVKVGVLEIAECACICNSAVNRVPQFVSWRGMLAPRALSNLQLGREEATSSALWLAAVLVPDEDRQRQR